MANQTAQHIHFIGIGGIGMSGIAEILMHRGFRISGSDRQRSAITDYLQEKGATIYIGHEAANVGKAGLVVFSSAVHENNPERLEAQRKGIRQRRRAEMLADLMLGNRGIAIAGTHGKTTTTSLCAELLIEAQLDPTVIVGGRLRKLMTNARPGNSEYFVTEADEYDRSFLALTPHIAIVTGIESDHLDIYRDLEDIKKTFLAFMQRVPFFGSVIACADDPNVTALLPLIGAKTVTYGVSASAQVRAGNIEYSESGSRFKVQINGQAESVMELSIPGEHNVKNALAVIALAGLLGISPAVLRRVLKNFRGVERRFEIKAVVDDIMVVDDYAHHPTEVKATLQAAKKGWSRKVIAVFQPHLFYRTRDFYREFAAALSLADEVIVTGIYPAREEPVPGVSGRLICDACSGNVQYVENKSEIPRLLSGLVRNGDMVITLGAGDIWEQGDRFIELLKKKQVR